MLLPAASADSKHIGSVKWKFLDMSADTDSHGVLLKWTHIVEARTVGRHVMFGGSVKKVSADSDRAYIASFTVVFGLISLT